MLDVSLAGRPTSKKKERINRGRCEAAAPPVKNNKQIIKKRDGNEGEVLVENNALTE